MNVTKHAIKRYKQRVQHDISDELAEKMLLEIAKKGKITNKRINAQNIMELEIYVAYKGVEILLIKNLESKKHYIITCLGDSKLRGWYRKQKLDVFRKMAM